MCQRLNIDRNSADRSRQGRHPWAQVAGESWKPVDTQGRIVRSPALEEWRALDAPTARSRTAGFATATARMAGQPLPLRLRARRPDDCEQCAQARDPHRPCSQTAVFPSTRTCSATPAASSSPMRVTIPDHCSTISATRISRIRCAIPTWHRMDSKDSGETELITPKTGRSGADWLGPHHRLEGEVVTRWSLKMSGW